MKIVFRIEFKGKWVTDVATPEQAAREIVVLGKIRVNGDGCIKITLLIDDTIMQTKTTWFGVCDESFYIDELQEALDKHLRKLSKAANRHYSLATNAELDRRLTDLEDLVELLQQENEGNKE